MSDFSVGLPDMSNSRQTCLKQVSMILMVCFSLRRIPYLNLPGGPPGGAVQTPAGPDFDGYPPYEYTQSGISGKSEHYLSPF